MLLLASFMDCAGISPEAEGGVPQWSRGAGQRLRVDGDRSRMDSALAFMVR